MRTSAKEYSGDASASRGGDLGDFKRGTLGEVLEDATFSLPVGGATAPIRTRQGFVILHVEATPPPAFRRWPRWSRRCRKACISMPCSRRCALT